MSVSPTMPAPCQLEQTTYRGWNCFRLSNGVVSLVVAPDIGGRVIQFQLGNHPFFFVNADLAGRVFPPEENGGPKGGWKNYGGSKLWPAPQGWENDQQWPGPPDPVLDGGRYEGAVVRDEPRQVSVTVTSPPDERTGLQFRRTISLFAGSSCVRLDCAMKNISQRPIRWALWEVTQLDTADLRQPAVFNRDFWAYCPLNPQSTHPKGFSPMFGQVNHPSYRPDYARQLLAVKYDYRVGKLGLDSPAGWLAAVNGQGEHCFVGRFTHDARAPYPDQASVEFWLNGAGEFILNGRAIVNPANPKETPYLMETEILSPLVDLAPGAEYTFPIEWAATRCPKPVVEVTSAGAVSRPLAASVRAERLWLEGVFGVFHAGHAEAIIKAADGAELAVLDLGPVGPAEVFRLARSLALPSGAYRVSVRLVSQTRLHCGWLGNVILPLA